MKKNAYTKTMITLAGAKVYCEYFLNEKPPILLLHGFVSSTYTFNRLIPLLQKNFSVIAIDLIGFGRSEKSTTFIYSYANYARLVAECIDYFQLKNVTIAGHSMGGQIALYTTRIIPQKINKLILLASSSYLGKVRKSLIYSSYLPLFHLIAKRKIQKQGVKQTLTNALYDPSFITSELLEEYGRPLKEGNFYKSLVRLLRHREGDLKPEQLQTIHTPALLIWGEKDNVVPLHVGRRLVKDLPNAKLITYEKAGHLITEERPKEIYEQILSFVLKT
ncbi:alpha/beta fold hydrolase [Virgibacillus alimentarius]|uniref:alpha/beta fold hydrolase n=1 Tax=Virgibacillus alimentarius TaxID=698769 RepID=UPI000AF31AB6|nr:alpha/beta hydrolase [Virgibacillus alimentarius]